MPGRFLTTPWLPKVAVPLVSAFVLLAPDTTTHALDNGVALKPFLGYSTWNYFNDAINDTLIRQLGTSLVSTGLAGAGYRTLNIDAGYLVNERHPTTQQLQVNTTKFPHGMRALADFLGALEPPIGLGVYTDHGNGSCGFGPGSYGHYDLDAQTFADWHVSYLKVDFCGFHPGIPSAQDGAPQGVPTFADWVDPKLQLQRWQALRDALNRTGREIYYSICPHGHPPNTGPSVPWNKNDSGLCYSPPLEWSKEERQSTANGILVEYTNLFDFWYSDHWQDFRHCGPTSTCPNCPYVGGATAASCSRFENGTVNPDVPPSPGGFLTDVDAMVALTDPEYSGPGSWADGDMLQVCNFGKGGANAGGRGDGGMTLEEYRSSYSIWAVLASPMIISADLRTLEQEHPECLAMLKNGELLAISQDSLAQAGALVRQRTNASDPSDRAAARTYNIVEQVFSRDVEGGGKAVVLFNRAETAQTISVSWSELQLPPHGDYRVRDIWAHGTSGADVGVFQNGYSGTVQPHAAMTLRISPASVGAMSDSE